MVEMGSAFLLEMSGNTMWGRNLDTFFSQSNFLFSGLMAYVHGGWSVLGKKNVLAVEVPTS